MTDYLPAVIGIPLSLALFALWLWIGLRRTPAPLEVTPATLADEIRREVAEILGEADRG